MSAEGAVRAGRVLVTGAGGFLGANVVWALRENGFHVRALLRRPPSGPQWTGLDGVEFAIGDILHSPQVAAALENVTAVIHTAALTRLIPRPRRDAYRVNVEATQALCAAALRAGVRRLVFTSSASTIHPGTADRPATEDSPDNHEPIHAPYYTSKRLAERVVRRFNEQGLETISLCPGYLIGPRDVRPTTNELLLYAARSRWPVLPPGGMNVLDVREAALAHVRALWRGQPGERYVLAGPYRSYRDLAVSVRRILGKSERVRSLPRWTKGLGTMVLALASGFWPDAPNGWTVPSFQYGFVFYHLSGARADRVFELAHRPTEETVFDTLRWFRDNGLAPWLPERLNPLHPSGG
jgi:dihydroflavonol-4-reductase